MDKIKITQKEFDDIYQIEEITGETLPEPLPVKDTTPFLTEEEEEQDNILEQIGEGWEEA